MVGKKNYAAPPHRDPAATRFRWTTRVVGLPARWLQLLGLRGVERRVGPGITCSATTPCRACLCYGVPQNFCRWLSNLRICFSKKAKNSFCLVQISQHPHPCFHLLLASNYSPKLPSCHWLCCVPFCFFPPLSRP